MRLGFTEVHMRELLQVFSQLDSDSSQRLEREEVRMGIGMMGKQVSHKIFDECFCKLDTEGSGSFDFLEFLEFMRMMADYQCPGENENVQKLAQRPKDLDIRILQRVLEYFRLTKSY